MKNIPRSFLVHFPAIIFGLVSVWSYVIGYIPASYLWMSVAMWSLISGLGIAVGYHRVFSHRTHSLPRWKENVILFFAVFAAQGSSIFWTAVHRGSHHRFSDTDKDFHSPNSKGFLEAFLFWHYRLNKENLNLRFAVDLLRKPNHVWFHENYILILWTVPLLLAFIDPRLAMAVFGLPMLVGNLQDNLVNIIGHKKCLVGYRNFETSDKSYNNPIFAFLTWGQTWHNNHHYRPASYDFGTSVSGNKWEFDPCRLFLPLIEK